jgi:hypothetical protein
VPAEMGLHLALHGGDLAVEDDDHRDGGPDGDRVGPGQDRGLAQRLGAQHPLDPLSFRAIPATPSASRALPNRRPVASCTSTS